MTLGKGALTPAQEAEAKALWDSGHTTKQLRVRYGVSAGVIAGLRDRRGWIERPNPTGMVSSWTPERIEKLRVMRVGGASWKAVAFVLGVSPSRARSAFAKFVAQAPAAVKPVRQQVAKSAQSRKAELRPPLARPLPPKPLPPPLAIPGRLAAAGERPCAWPLGEPKAPDFRFCCHAASRGRPYCPEHASIAYAPRQVVA